MTKTLGKITNIACIGEEIGLELGDVMVKTYRNAHPQDTVSYEIGRNILDLILAQPGCQGVRFYNAYNESGEKTLVYVGIDANGRTIAGGIAVDQEGQLSSAKGIVADRARLPGTKNPWEGISDDDGSWTWTID